MKDSFFKLAAALVASLIIATIVPFQLQAQVVRGAVAGTVRDASGAVIANASVTITNAETNVSRNLTTDENGFYRAGALEPGTYIVVVEQTGFTRVENRNVVVSTSTEVTYDVDLQVGNVGATVDVTASDDQAIALNKTNATVGTTIDTKRVVELPTGVGRTINNLALLSPNVNSSPGASGISANGQRTRNNNFSIDGSDNNDLTVTISTTPVVPEAVREFQVQTNPYNAEIGRNSGAFINVLTKSGSNRFTGDVFNYYSDSDFNSATNIEKRSGGKVDFYRNQFGFDIGGPIIKDRTFFFFLYQDDRRRGDLLGANIRIPTQTGFTALQNVPLRAGQTAANRQAVLNQLSFLSEIYSRSPSFSELQNTTVGGVPVQTGLVALTRSRPDDIDNYNVRIDHKISNSDNLTGRYIFNKNVNTNAVSNTQFADIFAGDQLLSDHNLAISETHVFNPSFLNEFRFSYIRRNLDFPENDPTTPTATISGFFTVGGASNFPQSRITDFFQFADTITYTVGKHNLRFGFDIRRNLIDNVSGFDTKGTFVFNNFTDFLQNNAFSYTTALPVVIEAAQTQQFYFIQDDFRITPELTLNLGLRYELNDVPFGFFGSEDPQQNAALIPRPVRRDTNNFAPVVGFAYSPKFEGDGFLASIFGNGQTSIRGGYRRSYDLLFLNLLTLNAGNFPISVTQLQNNVIDQYPNVGAPVSSFNPLNQFINTPEDATSPLAESYSLSVQRELPFDIVAEIGYTGSRSLNQVNQLQANPAVLTQAQIAAVNALAAVNQNPNVANTTIANTAAGSVQCRRVFPQVGPRTLLATSAQSTYNAGYLNVNKRFSNNLQFGVAYTFSKLLSNNDESLGVADITTGSPQVPQDFFDIGAEKSLSAFDRKHRFVTNFVYEVPLPNTSFFNNAVTKALLGGFQVSGIYQYQSGQPFTIITGADTNGNGTAGGDRPNYDPNGTFALDPVTGNLRTFTSPRVGGRFVVPFRLGAVLPNSLGNGNLGRNTFRAPGFHNTDLSVLKRFRLPFGINENESAIVIRADIINLFNQDNYGVPNNNLNSPNFGQNLNNWGNRSIVFSAKYSF